MRVLLVTSWPPTEPAGGVSTMLRTLIDQATEHTMLTLVNDWDAPTLRSESHGRLRILRLRLREPLDPRRPLRSVLGWIKDLVPTLSKLKDLCSREQIDVIHLHFLASYQLHFKFLKWIYGIPYIVTCHRGDIVNANLLTRLHRLAMRSTARGAYCVTAVSQWLKREAASALCRNVPVTCIPNGVSPDKVREAGSRFQASERPGDLFERYFITVANVTRYKGQDVLIRAWDSLPSRLANLHLVVVGAPRETWEECNTLIDSLGCRDRVHLLGERPYDESIAIMSRAEAIVMPSRSEGLPYVLLEAGVLGLATICTDIEPFLEVVTPGMSAIVVPREDAASLTAAIVRVADDPSLRQKLGTALHEVVMKEYTSEAMVRHYSAIYEAARASARNKPR